MVRPLTFKGEKKSKKRKVLHEDAHDEAENREIVSPSKTLTQLPPELVEDDSWVTAEAVTDVTGPIIIILPSDTPMCMACDANGKVFPSKLENVAEGDLAMAEPHDVRQVWIANRAAGTQEISLKGHQGRYLSCDRVGILSATCEAISPEESFSCIPCPEAPGSFNILTGQEKFLTASITVKGIEIRGDADSLSSQTMFRIRMQARFKSRFKKNKEQKVKEKISKKQLEEAAGRSLDEKEVRMLKKARVQGDYYEAMLDIRAKGKHDKYS